MDPKALQFILYLLKNPQALQQMQFMNAFHQPSVSASEQGLRGGAMRPGGLNDIVNVIHEMLGGSRDISLAAPAGNMLNAASAMPIPLPFLQQLLQQVQGPQG